MLAHLLPIAIDHVNLMRRVRQREEPVPARRGDERAGVAIELDHVERSQITGPDADQVVFDSEVEAITR